MEREREKRTEWQEGRGEKTEGESRRCKIKREKGRERERWEERIGLKFSDNEMSPVIVPAVINDVPLYSGSPCPWESKRRREGKRGRGGGREGGSQDGSGSQP